MELWRNFHRIVFNEIVFQSSLLEIYQRCGVQLWTKGRVIFLHNIRIITKNNVIDIGNKRTNQLHGFAWYYLLDAVHGVTLLLLFKK